MKKIATYLLFAAVLLSGCHRDEKDEPVPINNNHQNPNPENTTKDYTVHKFIWETSYIYYYWNTDIPSRLDLTQFNTPYDVFEQYRNTDDRFSAVLNNYSEVSQEFANEYTTDGINLDLYLDKYTEGNIVALVKYVYDNSPAAQAGIKRGQIIKAINGTTLTKNNYSALLSQNGYTLTYTNLYRSNDALEYNGEEFTTPYITKTKMNINSVLQVSTQNINGHNIGYFLYDSFDEDTVCIANAISQLAENNITDLVLDLRLNTGGYETTLVKLVSSLVPAGNEGKVFIKKSMNRNLESAYKKAGEDSKTYFTQQDTRLNLDKLYILTSNETASASEELISGLKPYMDITLIGDTTYGKYTSNYLLNDEDDHGTDDNGIDYSEWALYLVVACCTNSRGEMDFKNGFAPDYYIKDNYLTPLGDPEEPLFAKAISLITNGGTPVIAKRGAKTPSLGLEYLGNVGKPKILNTMIINKPLTVVSPQ